MKLLIVISILAVGTAALQAEKNPPLPSRKTPEYSLAVGEPYPSEVDLAYRRLWKFLQHLHGRSRASLQETPFVAVQVGQYSAAEVPAALARIDRGTAQALSFYSTDPEEPAGAQLKFIIVFDSRTRRPVGPAGFFVNDTPVRGALGKFGGITAVYAGTG
jgi:hypothetical protein